MSRLRSYWTRCRSVLLLMLISLAVGAGLVVTVVSLKGTQERNTKRVERTEDKAEVAKDKADVAKDTAAKTSKTAGEADRRSKTIIRYLRGEDGIRGVPGRNGVDGAPGPQGSTGVPGPPPSAAAIRAAVEDYCAAGRCSASVEDMAAAVARYCSTRECRGPRGERGPQGLPGAQGEPGPAGQDGAPPPQSFTLSYGPDFEATCVDPEGDRTYVCSPPPAQSAG